MKFHTTAPSAAKSRRQVNVHAQPYMISDYIGAAPRRGAYVAGNESNDNGLPQGFLVEQPAGASTQPHFHIHPQFQLVMDGGGMLGKHALGPLSLHYVNGFTPYGPIRAGNTGLLYFTLRRYWDPGAKYMPASREQLVKGNQRTRVGDVDPATTVRLPELTTTITTPVIEVEADGLAAWLIQAGPGMQLPSPPASEGDGQYHIVVAGDVRLQNHHLERLSCGFIGAQESPLAYQAGDQGAAMMICQFPRP